MKQPNNDGFVSLFTAIMLSLLLLVITVSLISLETIQLRKAVDAEQTLRAYYAAEAGVEDAVSKVLSNKTTQDCNDAAAEKLDYDTPGEAGWTCQQISYSGQPFGKLPQPDVATTVDPGNIGFSKLVVEWGDATGPTTIPYNSFYLNTGAFPSKSGYLSNGCLAGTPCMVAPIELTIVEYPSGGFDAADVCIAGAVSVQAPAGCEVGTQNVLIAPGGTNPPAISNTILYSSIWRNPNAFRGDCRPQPRPAVDPAPGGGRDYNCYATIYNFPTNKNFLIRVRSRYMPSTFRLTFQDASGAQISVPDGMATIDVTAKAGQTHRRVISKLPLSNGGAGRLNYVIYSDKTLCKAFTVLDNADNNVCPYN